MEEVQFLVQGSSAEPNEVIFQKSGNNLTGLCSCPAGKNHLHCKHRLNILDGNPKGIISGNEGDVKAVQSWVKGTDVEIAIRQVRAAEMDLEKRRGQRRKRDRSINEV